MRLTEAAHQEVKQHLRRGSIGIDATCGNGYDTLFLAKHVSVSGHVYAFDLQQKAVENTKKLLLTNDIHHVTIFQTSHEEMLDHIPSEKRSTIRAIMFNLGYLPGGDKTLTTEQETTITALDQSLKLLHSEGILSIMIYPDHPGGQEEKVAVLSWLENLQHRSYLIRQVAPAENKGPHLVLITER